MNPKSIKIASTIPPRNWFGGRDYLGAKVIIDTLVKMGIEVLPVETAPFYNNDKNEIEKIITTIRGFSPNFAFSLPNAGYGLNCSVKDGSVRRNVFTEILGIPLVVSWDDPLGQFARTLLPSFPRTRSDSMPGALSAIRAIVADPLMHHFAWDTGHIQALDDLGILPKEVVHHRVLFATHPYVKHGQLYRYSQSHDDSLSFVGNVYPHNTTHHPLYEDRLIRDLLFNIGDAKTKDITIPAWKLLVAEIEKRGPKWITEAKLGFDETYFWGVYEYVVWIVMNTFCRMSMISSIERNISFYGGFADPDGINYLRSVNNIDFKGTVDYVSELPEVFRKTRITVDVTNQLAQHSSPCKLFECFAACGFMLVDYKHDISAAFEKYANLISYKSFDELNDKIEYYLTHENDRLDISKSIRDIILDSYTTEKWLAYIIQEMGFDIIGQDKANFRGIDYYDNIKCCINKETYLGEILYKNRHILASERPTARLLHDTLRGCMKIGHPGDLPFHEWGQLMSFAYEFKPDLILEIGRGYGNSTCVFTHIANMLTPAPCRLTSICQGNWYAIQAELSNVMPTGWFDVADIHTADILTFDYETLLRDAKRVLVFWDAHGYAIAECVLSRILPLLQHKEHVVAMHDISDARYQSQSSLYGTFPAWPYGAADGICASHIRLGNLYSAVEQAIAIYDFSSRNDVALFTATHSLHAIFDNDPAKYKEVKALLHDDMFSLDAGWLWFSLDRTKHYTFPPAVMADAADMLRANEPISVNEQIGQFLNLGYPVSDDELKEASEYITLALSSDNVDECVQNTSNIPRSTKPLLIYLMRSFYNKKEKVQFEMLKSLYDLM